jgi:hypothetical protein
MFFRSVTNWIRQTKDWTHWPHYLFYFPIAIPWLGYYIKSRSPWFFTSANPTMKFGGFEGEGKRMIYEQLPGRYCPKSLFITPHESFDIIKEKLSAAGFTFPFIVKPDVGMKGLLFRKIENICQLEKYHQAMPADYIIQEFLDQTEEVSIFYCRMPNTEKGEITAMIRKILPVIVGDGVSTTEQLIIHHPNASVGKAFFEKQLGILWKTVLPKGEKLHLSHVANLVHGAYFEDLREFITPNITELFDEISHQSHFYYGRYDIKCNSVADLRKGGPFYILEFNGAGSVPNHVFAGSYSLIGAYKEIVRHWNWMYKISEHNHHNGHPRWSLQKGHAFQAQSRKHFNILKRLDKELVL